MKNSTLTTVAAIAVATCLFLGLNLWSQDDNPAAPATQKWQHLALPHDASKAWNDKELAQQINKLGREGWELLSVLNFDKEGTTDKTIYYFKKPM